MGITTYAPPVTTLSLQSVTSNTLPANMHYTITGYAYTNPNLVFTTSTAHNFQVGNQIYVTNMAVSGTNPGPTSFVVTAVTSTTFTVNYGATAPGTYTSGGYAYIYVNASSTQWFASKYMNNMYFFGGNGGHVAYSADGKNWTHTNVPNGGNYITAMDFDGTTYAFGDVGGKVFTSTTLAVGSFSDRGTPATGGVYDLKWCGGSINRWIVCGGTTSGGTGVIAYASSGAATWTGVTVSGTNTATYSSIAFDGSSTIVVCGGSNATSTNKTIAYSTNGTAFTGVAQTSTVYGTSNQATNSTPASHIWWNPGESRFVATDTSPSFIASATAANVSGTAWNTTGNRAGYWDNTQLLDGNLGPRFGGNPTRSLVNFDNGKLYTASWMDTNFRVEIRDATNPVTHGLPSGISYYPVLSYASINIPNSQRVYSSSFIASSARSATNWCYGNGAFVMLNHESQPFSYSPTYKAYLIA